MPVLITTNSDGLAQAQSGAVLDFFDDLQHDEPSCPNSTRRDTTAISTFGQAAMPGGDDARALIETI